MTTTANFEVLDWHSYAVSTTDICKSGCPSKFKSEILGETDLERIVNDLRLKIIESGEHPPKEFRNPAFEKPRKHNDINRTEYDCYIGSALYDKNNNLAAFVLVNSGSWFMSRGSRSTWVRGVYGIKRNKNKLKGKLIDFHRGHNYAEDDHFDEYNGFHLNELKNGILKYQHSTKYSPLPIKLNDKMSFLGESKFKIISEDKSFFNIVHDSKNRLWDLEYDLKNL